MNDLTPVVGKTYYGIYWRQTGEIEACLNKSEAEDILSSYPDTEMVKWYLVGKS